jgi:hypothetical protein
MGLYTKESPKMTNKNVAFVENVLPMRMHAFEPSTLHRHLIDIGCAPCCVGTAVQRITCEGPYGELVMKGKMRQKGKYERVINGEQKR